jgi:hypothetical protein
MYNVMLWRVRVTIVAVKTKNAFCVFVQLYVTVKYKTILGVAQQCFYGKFISLTTIQRTWVFM